jgi:para-aminobenzoate synthetase/4-amino-4-deoxychorismate lyase
MQILLDFCDPQGDAALRCAFETPQQTLVAQRLEQVKPLLDAVESLSRQGFWCVGYVRFEAAPAFDSALQVHQGDAPLAWFGVYANAQAWPNDSALDDENTSIQWHNGLTRADFDAQISRIHQAIAAGEVYQVNYTAPCHGDFSGAAKALFHRLHRAQPNGYAAFINTGIEQVLSVSPELFFDWKDGRILTRPMKGTAPRGSTAQEDTALAQDLVTSPKERAENVMIVDLLRNDLSRIAQPHSVKVPHLFQVQRLPTVFQMVSDVSASTRPTTTLSEVFGALFPCGSVTGAPKVQAMRLIKSLEPQPRGVYCGAIGVVRPGGHATFNVAIRTVTLNDSLASCGIGSGITWGATADAEWQEWQHKRGFLERASQPFKLLETLRLEHGIFHNLAAHLARLARAARHFGYPFDEIHIRQVVADLNTDLATWRVRLQLDSNGLVQAEKFIFNSTVAPVTLALAAIPFEASKSEFTRFKTTHRAHYEAFAPSHPEVFDTLLYNAAGELTECTRGNIAVLLDGHWITPPLRCGLLDGVGRAMALAEGRLVEAVVHLDDLPRVQGLAFVNSLRGWLDAKFRESIG